MKRSYLIVTSYIGVFALVGCQASKVRNTAVRRSSPTKAVAVKGKSAFQPEDLNGDIATGFLTIVRHNGRVQIKMRGGDQSDPPCLILRMLATVTQQDKKSSIFELTSDTVWGGSSELINLTYNRKDHTLNGKYRQTYQPDYDHSGQWLCHKVTDKTLLEAAIRNTRLTNFWRSYAGCDAPAAQKSKKKKP